MQGKDTHKHPSSFASDAERAPLRANGNGVSEDQLLTVEELAEIHMSSANSDPPNSGNSEPSRDSRKR